MAEALRSVHPGPEAGEGGFVSGPATVCDRLYRLQIIDAVKDSFDFFAVSRLIAGGERLNSSATTKNDTITTIKGISDYQFHPSANLEFSLLKHTWQKKRRWKLGRHLLAPDVTRGVCHVAFFLISGCAICFHAWRVSWKWGWCITFKVRSLYWKI